MLAILCPLALSATGSSGCRLPLGTEPRPDLRCGQIPSPRGASLCKRIEASLEPAHGHGQVMGHKTYQCTERAVLCPPDSITISDLDMMRELEAQGLELAPKLAGCLNEYRFLIEARQVPGSSVRPLQCS